MFSIHFLYLMILLWTMFFIILFWILNGNPSFGPPFLTSNPFVWDLIYVTSLTTLQTSCTVEFGGEKFSGLLIMVSHILKTNCLFKNLHMPSTSVLGLIFFCSLGNSNKFLNGRLKSLFFFILLYLETKGPLKGNACNWWFIAYWTPILSCRNRWQKTPFLW